MKKLILLPLLLISLFSFSQIYTKIGVGLSNGLTNELEGGYQFNIKDAPYSYQASFGVIYLPIANKTFLNLKYGVLLNDNITVHAGMGLMNRTYRDIDDDFRVSTYGSPIIGGEYNFVNKKSSLYHFYTGLDFFDLSAQLKFGIRFSYRTKK